MCMKLKTFNWDSLQYMLNILLKLYRMYNKTTAISLLGLDANTNIHELISVSLTNRRFALIWSICCLSFRFFLQERTIALNSLWKILFIVGKFFQKRLVLAVDQFVIRLTEKELRSETKFKRNSIRQFRVDLQDKGLSGNYYGSFWHVQNVNSHYWFPHILFNVDSEI